MPCDKTNELNNVGAQANIVYMKDVTVMFQFADIDDCADPSLCTLNGVCINEQGGFSCICNDGYTINAVGRGCDGMY